MAGGLSVRHECGRHLSVSARRGNPTGSEEVAWSESDGGESLYEPNLFQSVWQSSRRAVPDVSYNADPSTGVAVYDSASYQGAVCWFQVGRTSAGAPQWAALIALANAARAAQALPSLDQTNGALYSLISPSNFRDITTGSNGLAAELGFDLVTGLGSPLANSLCPELVSYLSPAQLRSRLTGENAGQNAAPLGPAGLPASWSVR